MIFGQKEIVYQILIHSHQLILMVHSSCTKQILEIIPGHKLTIKKLYLKEQVKKVKTI